MRAREVVSRDVRRLTLGADPVEYVLVRRRGRRGVALRVDADGLTVSAPATIPLARVEAMVRESGRWVLRKIAEWKTRQVPRVRWEDGARLPFLGAEIVLRLAPGGRAGAVLAGSELRVKAGDGSEEGVRRAVVAWYKRAAREHLGGRLAALAAAAGHAPPRFLLSPALSRWGSCNARREIRLAWRLVKAPPAHVDYVICHELAHLRQMNHSPAFWAEVERRCPDYRRLRAELFATDHLYRAF
ncbi:MAG TPA: SprT family zinc-dependent metalloprotease [Usitatibacter sp.]|nr:SprT family zinc-dependent metalloprotease [Usitatibacter sp.]